MQGDGGNLRYLVYQSDGKRTGQTAQRALLFRKKSKISL